MQVQRPVCANGQRNAVVGGGESGDGKGKRRPGDDVERMQIDFVQGVLYREVAPLKCAVYADAFNSAGIGHDAPTLLHARVPIQVCAFG